MNELLDKPYNLRTNDQFTNQSLVLFSGTQHAKEALGSRSRFFSK